MKDETILLKDLQDLLTNKHKYFMQESKGHTGIADDSYEGSQGEYNERLKFYKHPGLPEGIFMKETWVSDSYGNNDSIQSITFVKGKEKTVTVFEPI